MEALPRSRWMALGLGAVGAGKTTGGGPSEHLSPGYGAGYDAGFQAGLLAASQREPPPPLPALPPPWLAADGGAGASAPEPARSPFVALLEDLPDGGAGACWSVLEVLERLDRVDRALLGRTGSAARVAVKRSGLSRLGGSAEDSRIGIASFSQSLSRFVWAVANGCPWQLATTCRALAADGHLELLRWAREHGCPWNANIMSFRRWWRAPGGFEMGAGAGLPVGGVNVSLRRYEWSTGGAEVGAGARLPVGCDNVYMRRWRWKPGAVEVGTDEPVPLERGDV